MKRWFISRQAEDNRRYHKGTAYHNLGIALLGRQRITEARYNIILAFIEDAISFEDPSGAPAHVALRQVFNVSNDFLRQVIDLARRTPPDQQRDPQNIYQEVMGVRQPLEIPPREEISPLEEYERRIFVVDKNRLNEMLQEVLQARTNAEKKRSLETLSENLFGSVQGWSMMPSTRTLTGEMDRIIRN